MEKLQRILIVDGHAVLLAGLRRLLAGEPDIEVLADTRREREVIPAGDDSAPHLLLIDRTMPGMDDIEAVADIKRCYPGVRVLMIVPHETEDFILASLQAGVNGCVRSDATREELRTAIRSVLHGKSYLGMDASGNAVNANPRSRPSRAAGGPDTLTPRECDVLKLVAAGKSSKRIAECLSLSVKTVAKHRANLMAKLDLHNAAGLTAYALERGLLC
jgi:two-component system response regulator NreC